MAHPDRVAELVDGHRHQVVGRPVDLPRLRGVEEHVAGVGPAVGRGSEVGERQDAADHGIAADPDVAESGVALLVSRDPQGGAVVGDRSVKLMLATFCQTAAALANWAFQSAVANRALSVCLQIAGHAADARAVGDEAVGDQLGLGPLGTRGRVQQEPIFESLQSRTYRPRPGMCRERDVFVLVQPSWDPPSASLPGPISPWIIELIHRSISFHRPAMQDWTRDLLLLPNPVPPESPGRDDASDSTSTSAIRHRDGFASRG